MSRFSLFLAASVGAFLWANAVRAVTCTPGATCPSDTFQVTDANGNRLTDANGKLASVTLAEGAAVGEGVGRVAFDFAGVTIPASETVVLTEGTQFAGIPVVSDSAELRNVTLSTGPGVEVSFSSDGDVNVIALNCAITPHLVCIPETGAVQDVTALAFPGGNAPFHILMQSDPQEVPEPGTLALLGVSLAGLAAFGVRRRSA